MQFEELNLTHLGLLKELANRNSRLTCQLSAVSIWCYAEKYDTKACVSGETLFIRQNRPGFGVCYFCPVAPPGTLAQALAALREYHEQNIGGVFRIWGVTDEIVEDVKMALGTMSLNICSDRDWAEYIHTRENLIDMRGKRFHAKKNAVNQFLRQNSDFEYVEIDSENIAEVADFQKRLLMGVRKFEKDQNRLQTLIEEDAAISRGLEYYNELEAEGGILRIDGEISAYAFGGAIADNIFGITFEKALRSYNGIFQVLEQEMLKTMEYELINREEDLGDSGLRTAKERLRPDRLLMKYHFEV